MTPAALKSIRRARDSDLEAIRTCLSTAFAPYEARYTPAAFRDTVPTLDALARRAREMCLLVAEDASGAVVGTLAHQSGPSGEGHLRGMAVDPRRRH